jgi:hypothetical protein
MKDFNIKEKECFMKKEIVKTLVCALVIFAVFTLFFTVCGNGSTTSGGPPGGPPDPGLSDDTYTITEVIISPKIPYITRGTTLQFSAEVKGEYKETGLPVPQDVIYKGVQWSVAGVEGQVKHNNSVVSSTGLLSVAAAEDLLVLEVTVRSLKDTEKSDSVMVRVYTDGAWMPTVTGVTLDPPGSTIKKGTEIAFSATVNGTNDPAQDVTWSIVGTTHNSNTTLSPTGLLIVSPDEILSSITVRATSLVDDVTNGTAVVSLTPADILYLQKVLSYSGSAAAPVVYTPTFALDKARTQWGPFYEVVIQYKATGGSRVIGITTNDSNPPVNTTGNPTGSTNQGMPVDWYIDGESGYYIQEQFGTQHGYCNKRVFLGDTNGIWRTVRLSFSVGGGMYYWGFSSPPYNLLIYFNPYAEEDGAAEVMINYVTIRELQGNEKSLPVVGDNRVKTGDFEAPTGWTGITGAVKVETVSAPEVPGWFYENYVSITEQPAAGTMRLAGFTEPVTLSVGAAASDGGTLEYQWYQSASSGMSPKVTVGTNAAALPVTAAMLSNGEFFQCEVSSTGSGSVATSSVARVWAEPNSILTPNGANYLEGPPLNDGVVSLGQTVTLTPGTDYVLGIRYKADTSSVSFNAGPKQSADWFLDISENLLPATNGVWNVFATIFTAPTKGPVTVSDLSRYYVFLITRSNADPATSFAVDDIWLYRAADTAKTNMLSNGNFANTGTIADIPVINSASITANGRWYKVESWLVKP